MSVIGCGLNVLINEVILIPLDRILLSLSNGFTIFVNDLCDSYVKCSKLNAIFRHSSVAFDTIDVANYPTCHPERNF